MKTIYPFSLPDQELALKNAEWMNELGGCHGHECLIIHDKRCTAELVSSIFLELTKAFDKVEIIKGQSEIDGWPQGANYFFRVVAAILQDKCPYFFWMEPDAIPLSPGWLDALEGEYKRAGRLFMGECVDIRDKRPDVPVHMSGVGIYANPLHLHAGEAYRAHDVAWDIAAKDQIVPKAHFTKMIQHYWKHGTFMHLDEIRPETVIFHSSKDGSLIDVLRRQAAPALNQNSVETEPIGTLPVQSIHKLRSGTWVLENDATSGKVIETGRLDFDPLLPHILPLIRPGDTVVDAGAFIGDHTIAYSHSVGPTGKVIAFEPALSAFNCLIHNTEKCGNVFTFNQALGNHIGTAGMAADYPANVASHYIHGDGIIQVRKLDDHLSLLDRLDLIKIDVEGYELNVLKGAEQVITKFRPQMVIEINEIALKRQGAIPDDIVKWVCAHGYSVSVLYRHGAEVPFYDILCLPAATPPETNSTAPAHTIPQDVSATPVVPTIKEEVEWHVSVLQHISESDPQNKAIVMQKLVYAGLKQPNKKKNAKRKTNKPTNGERRPVAEEYTA